MNSFCMGDALDELPTMVRVQGTTRQGDYVASPPPGPFRYLAQDSLAQHRFSKV